MPAIKTESFYQDLNVLLASDDSGLAKLISTFFYQQQIGVVKTRLHGLDNYNFAQTQLSQGEFYKIIVCLNFSKPFDLSEAGNRRLMDLIINNPAPKIFLIRLSSKIDSPSPLLNEWKRQTSLEDQLVNYLYQKSSGSKMLMGLDVLDENNPLLQPYSSLLSAIPNGFVLDPQSQVYPQFLKDFFQNVKKELIRPRENHFLVRGPAVNTEELCLKIALNYQSLFEKSPENLDLESSSYSRLEKKEDIVEAVVSCDLSKAAECLVRNADLKKLGVDPQLLSPLLQNNPALLTKTSKPFKQRGVDFEFEPQLEPNIFSSESAQEEQPTSSAAAPASSEGTNDISNDISKREGSVELGAVEVEEKQDESGNLDHNKTQKHLSAAKKTASSKQRLKEDLDERVGRLFSTKRTEQKTKRRSEKAGILSRIKRKSKNKQAIFLGGAVVLIIGLFFGSSMGVLSLSYRRAQKTIAHNVKAFEEERYSDLRSLSHLGLQAGFLDKFVDIVLVENSLMLVEINNQLYQTSSLLKEFRHHSRQIYKEFLAAGQNDEESAQPDLISDEENHSGIDFKIGIWQDKLSLLLEESSQLQAELDGINSAHLEPQLASQLSTMKDEIRLLVSRLRSLNQVGAVLPDLFSTKGRKHYYILLQDNQELRPTGGFLQAVAMIVVENGSVIDHQVYTTNSIDSRVLGQMTPPAEVESFLGEANLHLRDANWDPNFASSAKSISWFIREALNQPVDGLISINYNQVREMLAVFGDLYLPDYGGGVTAQNLYSRLESNAPEEKDRDREQNIHTTLLNSLVERMKTASDEEIDKLTTLLHQSLRNQDAALYFDDPGVGSAVSELGWSGSIVQPECPTNFGVNCKTDYIYQVEANVGVNKVNQYVTSGVNHSISIQEGVVSHRRRIRYENRAHSGIWPLGEYRAYIRFYVDSDASLKEIQFNGELVSEDLIMEYIDHNRRIFGILINVPEGEQLDVDLHYSTPLSIEAGGSYFFFEQPQPGVSRRLSTISLNHPEHLESELISPMVEVNQNQIVVASDVGSGFVAIRFAD